MRPREEIEQGGGAGGATEALTLLQTQFLERLHDLVAKKEQQLKIDAKDKLSLRLLARALYATYMDCVANGVGDQAADVLDKAQAASSSQPASRAGVTKGF